MVALYYQCDYGEQLADAVSTNDRPTPALLKLFLGINISVLNNMIDISTSKNINDD